MSYLFRLPPDIARKIALEGQLSIQELVSYCDQNPRFYREICQDDSILKIYARDPDNLIYLASVGDLDFIKRLVRKGIHLRSKSGYDALVAAIFRDQYEVARYLIPKLTNEHLLEQTIVEILMKGSINNIKFLVEAGVPLPTLSHHNYRQLIHRKKYDVMDYLINLDPLVNASAILDLLIYDENIEGIRFLLDHDITYNIHVKETVDPQIIDIFREAGARVTTLEDYWDPYTISLSRMKRERESSESE